MAVHLSVKQTPVGNRRSDSYTAHSTGLSFSGRMLACHAKNGSSILLGPAVVYGLMDKWLSPCPFKIEKLLKVWYNVYMKICTKCNKEKDLESFSKKVGELGGRQPYCKDCAKAYKDNHYQANKKKYLFKNSEYALKRTEFINSLKVGKPCADCGDFFPPYVMDFDHLGEKEFLIARMRNHSFESILKEVKKCELVCSNCHRERTHKRSIALSSKR